MFCLELSDHIPLRNSELMQKKGLEHKEQTKQFSSISLGMMRTSKSGIVFRGPSQSLQIVQPSPSFGLLRFRVVFTLRKRSGVSPSRWEDDPSRVLGMFELGWGFNNRIIDTSQVVKEFDVFEGRCIRGR